MESFGEVSTAFIRPEWIKIGLPEPGRLIVKLWFKKQSYWAGIYNGTDKEGSFDAWMYLPRVATAVPA